MSLTLCCWIQGSLVSELQKISYLLEERFPDLYFEVEVPCRLSGSVTSGTPETHDLAIPYPRRNGDNELLRIGRVSVRYSTTLLCQLRVKRQQGVPIPLPRACCQVRASSLRHSRQASRKLPRGLTNGLSPGQPAVPRQSQR